MPPLAPRHQPRDLRPVRNMSDEAVPPFAPMEPYDWDDDLGLFLVRKPSQAGLTNVLFNGISPIPAYDASYPERSQGQGAFDLPATSAYSSGDSSQTSPGSPGYGVSPPAFSDVYVTQPNSWFLWSRQDDSLDGYLATKGSNGLVEVYAKTTSASVTRATVRIISAVSVPGNPYCCTKRPECFYLYYLAALQRYDPACGDFTDVSGQCVLVFERNGRLLLLGNRYGADFVIPGGNKLLHGFAVPAGENCNNPDTPPLYVAENSDGLTIKVDSVIGPLCAASGSGSYGSGSGGQRVLKIYAGHPERYNEQTCAWDQVGPTVLIAHNRGCDLVVGNRYQGTWHKNVPLNAFGSGSGSGSGSSCSGSGCYSGSGPKVDDCYALFLTAQTDKSGLKDVRCIGGVQVVYRFTGDCDEAAASAEGCCSCTDGSTSGSGGGVGCPCDGVPTSNCFQVGTFTLTNSACSPCNTFPSTITLRKTGSCTWLASTLSDPCGGSLSATLVATNGGGTLFIGGGGHDVGATYTLSGTFNCNGNNTFTKQTNGSGCAGWPATVSVNAVAC